MKKWLAGLVCVGMWATVALGQVASLPTTWSGPWTNANLPMGWANVGLGVDYSGTTGGYDSTGGGPARFDGAGDLLTISFDSAPGDVTYWARLNVGSGTWTTNVFSLQESVDGTDWSDITVYNDANPIPTTAPTGPYTSSPSASARYLRFHYVQKGNGNVGVDGVTIAAGSGVTPTNVKFHASSAAVSEGQGTYQVTVYKTLADGNVSGQIALSGTASEGVGADYTVNTTNFTLNGATTSTVITVTINDDEDEEIAETVVLDFANVVGAGTTAPATFTLTIGASDQTAYGISIVTNAPSDGTVTTTPAGEAIAGTPVTIGAFPASGYAVQSIAVNDGTVAVSNNVFTMPAEPVTVAVTFAAITAEGIVDFRFNAAPYLPATVKDANLTVSDLALTAGTIETNVITGTYFTDEPYVEETGGWGVSNQASAKAFQFTITPAEGASVTIDAISFKAYATAAGPSAYGIDVGGLATYSLDAPSASLLVVSQAVAGVVSQTGAIVVKIQGWANGSRETAGTGVFRLDDVVVHGSVSTGPLEFSVSFNKLNGFTVEQGSSDSIMATAANGTAPYGYVWTSSLGEDYRTADTNVFTILATAPIGVYTAQVVATDSDTPAKSVTNSLNFSVVAPPPKYAISIVTNNAGEGTVTTTPATEAAAGVTVTVNATPAGGYAVESIVVNGGAVTVTGNTFAMPAGPATVTVTFMEYEAPDVLIDFEDYTTNTYALHVYNTAGVSFNMTNILAGGAAGTDRFNGTKSARFHHNRTAGNAAIMSQTVPFAQPITRMNFWFADYGTDLGGAFKVQVSEDGTAWTDVGEATYDPAGTTLEMAEINVIPANMTYVQFVGVGDSAKRFNVDDVGIFFGAAVPSLSYTGATTIQMGQSFALTFTLNNGTASGWEYLLESASREDLDNGSANVFNWTPTSAGTYYLTMTALDEAVNPIATREVTLTVNSVDPDQPAVVIAGSRSGTVGVQMNLAISVTNGTAEDWFIDLKDPTGADDFSYAFNGSAFTLTPTMTGTYVLVATAQTGSGNVSNTANLVIGTGGGGEMWQIGDGNQGGTMFYTASNQNVVIVLPTNYTLDAVYGTAPSAVGLNNLGQGIGSPLQQDVDYNWNPATRTISVLSGVTNRRVLRIGARPQ